MRLLLVSLTLLLLSASNACASSRGRVSADPVTASSALDGDATAIIEGCGNQPVVGYTYCRVQEGSSAASQSLWFIGPPAKCDREACVYVKVWDNTGSVVGGGSIPKGQTRLSIPWTKLLNAPTFEINHRGSWTWNLEVYWKDTEGRENVSKAQGDITLRVFRAGYIPLQEVASDPAFVWEWVDNGYLYKMTSGLRASVQKVK